MSGDVHNPYSSPSYSGNFDADPRGPVRTKVLAPAVALMIVAALGTAISLFNVGYAIVGPKEDPMAPEFIRQMQQGAQGVAAAAVQGAFVLLNLLLFLGGLQMSRFRNWGLAVAASVLAMVNFGSCCCVLGLPIGIWSLVVLLMPDVKYAFLSATARG